MGITDFFNNWVNQTILDPQDADGTDLVAEDVDEPPDHAAIADKADFRKAIIRPQVQANESLLTKALQHPIEAESRTVPPLRTEQTRRRSMNSNASLASTAELTSDGGLESPARINTPSPPLPRATYTSFAPYSFAAKSPLLATMMGSEGVVTTHATTPEIVGDTSLPPMVAPEMPAPPKKRSISFACGGIKEPVAKSPAVTLPDAATIAAVVPAVEALKRRCTIKFACGNNSKPQTENGDKKETSETTLPQGTINLKPIEPPKRLQSRSPSTTRKLLRPPMSARVPSDSASTIRKFSRSPTTPRTKPKYEDLDEKALQSSEATRFHEFASEEPEVDDWIRKECTTPLKKLTIHDTLQKENAIRRLGTEAEEEAEQEDEDAEDDASDSNDEDNDPLDEDDEVADEDSDDEATDGNETDNEAGFAESDESDGEGEFAFWTPGRNILGKLNESSPHFRPSTQRAASTSSIDSLHHMSPKSTEMTKNKKTRRRPVKIRPGTPDLPDSTDFVCGTLDEDRPLEVAYVSCMEAKKIAKHKQTPQDIDPSFPTTDPEDEEDEHDHLEPAYDSEENTWIHGKFEESDEEQPRRRRRLTNRRKSPAPSPKRLRSPPPPTKKLHSPPPPTRRPHSPAPKPRLRSPPPRKLFGHSPKQTLSASPEQIVQSPPASPTQRTVSTAIPFAPLGSRPGLTHTKSLPRAPDLFCRHYRAARLATVSDNVDDEIDNVVNHVRKAIDIVKGLERKRHYRREKWYKSRCKNQTERKPMPGQGAERMREVGLHMAGKTTNQAPYMLSA